MTEDIINKVPNPPFEVEIIDTVPVEVANPYSGEKIDAGAHSGRGV
jgi:hypothetical protein